jgi:hypothetical protein
MTLHEVVVVMLNSRRPNQYASLESGRSCPEASVEIVAHAGEPLAKVGGTRVYAAGFASIQTLRDQGLRSEGFERAATLLDAIQSRERELLTCRDATMAFDAVTEGACGRDRIALTFDENGSLASVSSIEWSECVPSGRQAPSDNEFFFFQTLHDPETHQYRGLASRVSGPRSNKVQGTSRG